MRDPVECKVVEHKLDEGNRGLVGYVDPKTGFQQASFTPYSAVTEADVATNNTEFLCGLLEGDSNKRSGTLEFENGEPVRVIL